MYEYNDRDRDCVSIEKEKSVYKERKTGGKRECVEKKQPYYTCVNKLLLHS